MAYLDTRQLSVGYHNKALIREISLSVQKGEIVTLIGPNGAGKSTILKSIIQQLPLIHGAVYLDDQDMRGLSEGQIATRMSILMTGRVGAELMSGWDVVATGRYPYTGRLGILSADDRKKVARALELVNAAELAERPFDELSDGQRQRLLLARAICQEPELIVFDEPTSFLDIHHKLEFLNLLKSLVREQKLAALLSLHELELAQKISDKVVCVKGTRIFAVGSTEHIFQSRLICELYDIPKERYVEGYGTVELAKAQGVPDTFVISGGGTGIPVYRRLQREGAPFIAGILQEQDQDVPVALALAGEVILSPAFEPISEATLSDAKKKLSGCGRVICTLPRFGTQNEANKRLLDYAKKVCGELIFPSQTPAGS